MKLIRKDGSFEIIDTSVVDIDNEFVFRGVKFLIPKDNKDYLVFKKFGEEDDYENESKMDRVSIISSPDGIKFYNQLQEEIYGVTVAK